jgi:hypothetical protein
MLNHAPSLTGVAARVFGVYAELPMRFARCRTPFEVMVEQYQTGRRFIEAFRVDRR